MLIVTTDDLPGYQVRQVLGEVIGVAGRTRNPFQERVRAMHGGGNPHVLKVLKRYRLDAVDQMVAHAQELGANAIVGMRFDHRNVSDMWGEICAYGTAVLVDPPPGQAPADAQEPAYAGQGPDDSVLNPAGEVDPEIAPAID
jgi:uncharacterized protein YbjQ (UPF0145 family)